ALVALTPSAGVLPRQPISTIAFSRKTDADGRFAFKHVTPGRYSVGVAYGSAGEDKGKLGARALADVEVGATEGQPLDIVLETGVAVSGVVTSTIPGNTVPQIYVFDADGEALDPINPVSAKDGKF